MGIEEKNKLIKQCVFLGVVLLVVTIIAIVTNSNVDKYSYDTKVYPNTVINDFENSIKEVNQNNKNEEINNIVLETIPKEIFEPNVIKGESGTMPNIEIHEIDYIEE